MLKAGGVEAEQTGDQNREPEIKTEDRRCLKLQIWRGSGETERGGADWRGSETSDLQRRIRLGDSNQCCILGKIKTKKYSGRITHTGRNRPEQAEMARNGRNGPEY